MAKKRPTLDAFLNTQSKVKDQTSSEPLKKASPLIQKPVPKDKVRKNASEASEVSQKPEVVRHMLYLPIPVYDQLQELLFEEQRGQKKRRKMHDYFLDAIDLLFKEKGLKSIDDLVTKS